MEADGQEMESAIFSSADSNESPQKFAAVALKGMLRGERRQSVYRSFSSAMKDLNCIDVAIAAANIAKEISGDCYWAYEFVARAALEVNDYGIALLEAEFLMKHYPDRADPYFIAGLAARQLGRMDAARSAIVRARTLFPDAAWPLLELGWIAISEGDHDAASEAATQLRLLHPLEAGTRGFEITALRASGKMEEAVTLALASFATFWDQPWLWRELQLMLLHTGRSEEAQLLAFDSTRFFPNTGWSSDLLKAIYPASSDREAAPLTTERAVSFYVKYPVIGAIYRSVIEEGLRTGQWQLVEDVLKGCEIYFDCDFDLSLLSVDLATLTRRFDLAEPRLRRLLELYPRRLEGMIRLAKILAGNGKYVEADAICVAAVEAFPENSSAYDCRARIALLSGDYRSAADFWRRAIEHFPNDPRLKEGLHDAILAGTEAVQAQGGDHVDDPPLSWEADADPKDLMLMFQSLGSPTHGCEFGNVQRFFGAEPINLLRWVAARPASLSQAIDDGFKGFWAREETRVSLGPVPGHPEEREYRLYLTRYDIHIHTFIYVNEADQDTFLDRYQKRQKLLARKFYEDLEESRYIFLYKEDLLKITDDEIIALHETLKKIGPDVVLLFLRHATPDHPEGSVGWLRSGIMVGYLENFIIHPDGVEHPIRYDGWLAVCREAARLRAAILRKGSHQVECELSKQ